MARSAFERVIELQLQKFSPERAKEIHVAIARKGLGEYLAGQSAKPVVQIETDGHSATSETNVQPFGIISYRFLRMPQVGRLAIQTARDESPVESGRYKRAWFLLADGSEVSEDEIPPDVKELILVNDVEYARKIELRGARIQGVPPGIVEKVRQIVLRQYAGQVIATVRYLTLSGGYQLKRPTRRRGRGAHELTYPALAMTPRV